MPLRRITRRRRYGRRSGPLHGDPPLVCDLCRQAGPGPLLAKGCGCNTRFHIVCLGRLLAGADAGDAYPGHYRDSRWSFTTCGCGGEIGRAFKVATATKRMELMDADPRCPLELKIKQRQTLVQYAPPPEQFALLLGCVSEAEQLPSNQRYPYTFALADHVLETDPPSTEQCNRALLELDKVAGAATGLFDGVAPAFTNFELQGGCYTRLGRHKDAEAAFRAALGVIFKDYPWKNRGTYRKTQQPKLLKAIRITASIARALIMQCPPETLQARGKRIIKHEFTAFIDKIQKEFGAPENQALRAAVKELRTFIRTFNPQLNHLVDAGA